MSVAHAASGRRMRLLFAGLLMAVLAAACWLRLGPLPPGLLEERRFVSTSIVDRNGVVLYDGLSDHGTRGSHLLATEIPPHVRDATLAAEDRRFFGHPGIDPFAIARAAWANLRAGRTMEGASTLTQQTAKLLLGDGRMRERGVRQKLEEAIVALRLEHRLSKREILALYLNIAPYGNQLIGVERASQAYFGVTASQLTTAQSAMLAVLPRRPTELEPIRHPDAARSRQAALLKTMFGLGMLARPDYEVARVERLTLHRATTPLIAPHFASYVRELVTDRSARRIVTTLDSELQLQLRGIVEAQRENLRQHGAHNVAVAVLDNDSGEWLAWEGSGDYFDADNGGAIDGVRALRQPGSTLKPFTYALAFERQFDPASALPDVESHFSTAVNGIVYAPRNYDGHYRGPLLARNALAGSVNVPAVWLLSQLGPPSLLRFLRVSGFTSFDRSADYYGLGLTLGDAEVRLDELVAGYSSFATGGVRRQTRAIRQIESDSGVTTFTVSSARAVMSPTTSYWISDILADSSAREFIFGSGGNLDFPFPVSVKTGTSQAYRDNWTIGFTPRLTVGVWVGNFDRAPLRNSSGVTGAAPIFHAVMLAAAKRYPSPQPAEPPALQRTRVCALSGGAATLACPAVREELLPAGRPRAACGWHVLASRRREDGSIEQTATIDWPQQYRDWARSRSSSTQVAVSSSHRARQRSEQMTILNPPDGATYSIDPTLRREFQSLRLRAASPRGGEVSWRIDGQLYQRSNETAAVRWPLVRGSHVIEARDAAGHSAARRIVVR